MDFEQLVCYSQTLILFLLLLSYLISYRNQDSTKDKSNIELTCPSCDFLLSGEEINFCNKCGNSVSHSKGLALEK